MDKVQLNRRPFLLGGYMANRWQIPQDVESRLRRKFNSVRPLLWVAESKRTSALEAVQATRQLLSILTVVVLFIGRMVSQEKHLVIVTDATQVAGQNGLSIGLHHLIALASGSACGGYSCILRSNITFAPHWQNAKTYGEF